MGSKNDPVYGSGRHRKNPQALAPKLANKMIVAKDVPIKLSTTLVFPSITLPSVRHKTAILRNQSDSTLVVIAYAEIDGNPLTNMAVLSHDKLSSSVKTRPTMRPRYDGVNLSKMVSPRGVKWCTQRVSG
jgi:hypothetical protein